MAAGEVGDVIGEGDMALCPGGQAFFAGEKVLREGDNASAADVIVRRRGRRFLSA
jgi:hypothetical protein